MRRRTVVQLVGLACMAGVLAINVQGIAESPANAAAPIQEKTIARAAGHLRVAVDGGTNPEAVPDEVAYRLFVKILAVSDQASTMEIRKREAFLNQVGLSAADREAVVKGLSGLGDTLKEIQGQRKQLTGRARSGSSDAQLSDLLWREDAALDDALLQTVEALSWEGKEKLERHVRDRVRRRVIIYDSGH